MGPYYKCDKCLTECSKEKLYEIVARCNGNNINALELCSDCWERILKIIATNEEI